MHNTKISLLALLLCEKRDISGSPEGIRTLVAGLRSQSPRPLDDGALVSSKTIAFGFRFLLHSFFKLYCAGVPGLEPRLTEPESAGLPITPYPKVCTLQWQRIPAVLERQSRVNTQ
jgi:hypothetical protein